MNYKRKTLHASVFALLSCIGIAAGQTVTPDTLLRDTNKIKKKTLQQVNINGKPVLIIQNVDRSIIKVENNTVFKGDNLEEVLEKIPGIVIGSDNRVSVNGSNSVKYQIDGRDVPANDNVLKSLLKSIQSSTIKDIEIISPSAKSDAQNSARILNINTVHSLTDGYSLNPGISYAQGTYPSGGVNLFAQAKIKKFSFQLLSSFNLAREYSTTNSSRTYIGGDNLTNDEKNLNDKNSLYNKIDLDYSINKKTNTGVSFSNTFSNSTQNNASLYNVFSGNTPDSTLQNKSHQVQDYTYYVYSIYLKRSFDTTTHSVLINFDLNKSSSNQYNQFDNYLLFSTPSAPRPDLQNLSQKNSGIVNPALRIDYTKTVFNKNSRVEIGLKYSTTKDNEYFDYQPLPNNTYYYQEGIFAQYISFLYQGKNISAQAGIRGENTNATGLINNTPPSRQQYYDLFPSLSLQKKLDHNKLTLTLGFRRRIQRPSFLSLSPFLYYISPVEAYQGNANLSPTLIDEYSLSASYKGLYISGSYNPIKNAIALLPVVTNAQSIVINEYVNIGTQYYKAINIAYPFTLATVSFNPSVSGNFSKYENDGSGLPISKSTNYISLNLTGSYKLNKTSRLELRSFYLPKDQTLYSTINHKSGVTLRYSQSFMNDNLSLKIAAEDIFNQNKESGTNQLLGYQGQFSNFYDNRRISVSVSYSIRNGQRVNVTNTGDGNRENSGRINP